MQRDLIRLMHEPRIAYVSGGHLTTVLQAEKFIETIRAFLELHPIYAFPEYCHKSAHISYILYISVHYG